MGRAKGKLSKGQPKGARSASGRKRDRAVASVMPSEGVMRRRELHGQPANDVGEPDAKARRDRRGSLEADTCDALGRAYCAGLLGNDRRAQDRLLAGRKVAAQYWRAYGFLTPDSLARFQPQEPSSPIDTDRAKIMEDALNDALALVRARGRDIGRAFEQLVIDINPDHGPLWLDRIVYAHRSKRIATEPDSNMLRLAIEGLDAIS